MLAKDAWKPHEPRFGFPVFGNAKTRVSFSIQPDFRALNGKKLPQLFKAAVKAGWLSVARLGREIGSLALSPGFGSFLNFRLILTTRYGKQLGVYPVASRVPPGGSVDVDMDAVLDYLGQPIGDYMGILVMSRGRSDGMRSSPGSYSMTYFSEHFYTTYRTGGFARLLNDSNRRRHHGFRGINPKAIANDRFMGSILLINHSSNPSYDETVHPKSLLLRPDGATREADFGAIAPFGGVERSLEDLFGSDVVEFLKDFDGKATVITTCPDVTLASIHLMRARNGCSMSIEHSRPTHTYLLNGVS